MGGTSSTQTVESLRRAFAQGSDGETRQARAALLLGLGLMLRPPNEESRLDFAEDQELDWPRLYELQEAISFSPRLIQEIDFAAFRSGVGAKTPRLDEVMGVLYGDNLEEAGIAALRLIGFGMSSRDELVRAAACLAWFDVTNRLSPLFVRLARIARSSDDELARSIALHGLYRLLEVPSSIPSIARFTPGPPSSLETTTGQAVIVHGTVFKPTGKPIDQWWKPGSGDFHQYLKQGPRPNVYSGDDYFRWSGGWNDYAREEAAEKLIDWLDRRNIDEPDVFAHSHGGNVAMLASAQTRMNKLVLMSCPVHWHLYQPHFDNVGEVISIRIKWDLVIMADRGAQRFRHDRIHEEVLPIWFTGHEESRLGSTWEERNLDNLV